MARNIVTLYIDDTSLRLLATSGKQVRKWADVALEPGLVKNAVVLKQQEVATRIKQLLKTHNISSKKVILGVSGLNSLTRPVLLPQLPKDMLQEAVEREAQRVIPVSMEQLYLSWKSSPATEGKTLVFLAATPRNVTDTIFHTLKLAGLKPVLMDTKPFLLTRIVKDRTAIIIDLQPAELDIIIKVDGIPQPIRTISLPSENMTWHQKLAMIEREINRTIDFYNTDHKKNPLTPVLPIFVSGDLAGAAEQCEAISHKLNRAVIPIPAPFENPRSLNAGRYLLNMGLVLKKIAPLNGSSLSLSNLNLLPRAYQPEPISLVRITLMPSLVGIICLFLFLVLTIRNAQVDITDVRSQLDATTQLLQQKLSKKQQLTDTVSRLENEMKNIEKQRYNIEAALANFKMQGERMNGDLEVTINTAPETVSLTEIRRTDSTFTINGLATSEEELLSYLSELDASARFRYIKIASMSRAENQKVRFNVTLTAGF